MGSEKLEDFYQKAEEKLNEILEANNEVLPDETQFPIKELFHKLQIQRIELEMQNEKLQKSKSQLKADKQKYANLYNYAPVIYLTLSDKGKIINANLTACKKLHTSKQNLTKKSLYPLIKKEDRDRLSFHLKQVFKSDELESCELRVINNFNKVAENEEIISSNYFWALLKSKRFKNEKGNQLCRTVINDITEMKNIEKGLKISEQEKSLILNNTNEIISVHDTEQNIVWANENFLKKLGLTLNQVKDKKCYLAWGLDSFCKNCPTRKAISTGKPQRAEISPDNQEDWPTHQGSFLVSAAPLKNKDDKVIGAVEMVIDISRRKKAEKKLEQYKNRLKKLNYKLINTTELEREKISRELHDELGQELSSLSINLNLIRTQLPENIEDEINKRIDDSLNLIDDLLEQIHEISLELRPMMLDDLGLIPTIENFIETFESRNNIETKFTAASFNQELDSTLKTNIYRIIQEALNNVAKHSRADQVRINISENREDISLIIEDNGIGFSPETYESYDPETESLGLLGIKERAEFLDGKFDIHSEEGQGTRLIITIPGEGRDE
jgi:PAS domain S-box-containing protein